MKLFKGTAMGSAAKDLDRLARESGIPRPHGLGTSAEGDIDLGAHVVLVRAPKAPDVSGKQQPVVKTGGYVSGGAKRFGVPRILRFRARI